MTTPTTPTTPTTQVPAQGPLASLDRFWFQPGSPATLSAMRVFTGVILLYVHFCYTFSLMQFVHPDRAWLDEPMFSAMRQDQRMYSPADEWNSPNPAPQVGPDGKPVFDPYYARYRLAFGRYMWSVFFHVHDDTWIWILHFTFLGVIVLFAIGLWTPVTSVLAWMVCLQYIHRSPYTLFGMDTMINIGLFYLMLGPCGAMYSADAWLAQMRGRWRRDDPDYVQPVAPSVMANVCIRLLQIHFCMIYLASGTSKLLGSSWWNGTALWNAIANFEFAPYYLSFYEPTLKLIATNRPFWEFFMTGGVIFTLVLEVGLPFLVWVRRLRWGCVLGAVALHTGIGLTMGLIVFSLMMMVLVASFIPSEAVERAIGLVFGRGAASAQRNRSPRQRAPSALAEAEA